MSDLVDISFNLLGVLGTLLAFEGFIIALLYSRQWSRNGRILFKIFTGVMAISIAAIGLLCITTIDRQLLEKLVLFGVVIGYIFYIPVVSIAITAIAVAIFVVIKA